MLRVSVKYLEKSAIIALPCEIDRMRKILDNLGCDREISKIPLITDENTELTVKVYSYGNLEKAIISKISKNDSLFDLNQLAEYLDRQYSLEPEFVQNMDVSGLQNLYLKLLCRFCYGKFHRRMRKILTDTRGFRFCTERKNTKST